jgi:hypothetical protein
VTPFRVTERASGILEDTLRHFVGPYLTDWDEYLAIADFAMNNAWNQSIQKTPLKLNFGQHPDTPEGLGLRSRNPIVNKFVGQWSKQLARAKKCIEAAQTRQKYHPSLSALIRSATRHQNSLRVTKYWYKLSASSCMRDSNPS